MKIEIREQKAILLTAYKYFYRPVTIDEFRVEAKKERLLDMSDEEFEQYRLNLIREHKAIEEFFGVKISDLLKARDIDR